MSPSAATGDLHLARARALLERDQLGEAEIALRALLAAAPASVQGSVLLGNVLNELGRPEEAIAHFEHALSLDPGSADALANLGNALQYLGRLDHAVAYYGKALALDPRHREAQLNLGNALESLDRQPEARERFAQALALDGDYVEARWASAMSHLHSMYADVDQAQRCRAAFDTDLRALDAWFDDRRAPFGYRAVGNQQPFALAYQERDNRDLLERYGALCVRLVRSWPVARALPVPARRPAGGPVRVGVVSQHFYDHSVWHAMVRGWFEGINAERFALHAFHLGAREDAETVRCRRRAAVFHMGGYGLRAWIDLIVASRLDALIYPDIGMDPMATKLASLRLAPLQLASWGHPETTGLGTIDGYLSAEGMEPEGAQAHYTEHLIALPNLGCSYARSGVLPEIPEVRPAGPILVCPGTPYKYAPEHDAVYARIARQLGRGSFVFFVHRERHDMAARLMDRLRGAFRREGLRAEDFAVLLPWLPRARFHGLMQGADVYLDTIGFSGFNTAMQAIECALPVVTQEGRFLRGRFASAILRRIGLPELVARDAEDYVRIAVRLASDAPYRERVRQDVRARRDALFDDAAPIRALEDVLAGAVVP